MEEEGKDRLSLEEVERMENSKNKKGAERANRSKGGSDGLCDEAEGVVTIVEHQFEDGRGSSGHCYMFDNVSCKMASVKEKQ